MGTQGPEAGPEGAEAADVLGAGGGSVGAAERDFVPGSMLKATKAGTGVPGTEPELYAPGPLAAARQIVRDFQNRSIDTGLRAKDKLVRNLQQTEAASPRAAELFAGAGSAEQRARVAVADLIRKSQQLGLEPDEALGGLIDSQLRGMRDLYAERAEEIRQIDPDAINELITDGLDRDIQRLNPKDKTIVRTVQKMSPEDQRAYLLRSFESAANQIKVDPQFDDLRQTPNYQQFVQYYKDTLGDKLQQYHTESGGDVLSHLGPDNAYFPLSRIDQPPLGGFNRFNPFKTATARNKLRSGLGSEYDTSARGLVKPLAEIFKKDSLDAGIDHLVEAGAIKRLTRTTKVGERTVPQGAPDEMMLNGRIERAVTHDLGNGIRLAMPETLYRELQPVFEANRDLNSFFKGAANTATNIQMLGPVDPIFHAANVMSAMYRRSIPLMYGLAEAAKRNPNVTTMYGKFLESISTDPFSPSNMPYLRRLLEGGQVPPRWGREAYREAGAQLTGGKRWWDTVKENPANITHVMGPLLNGPKGLDIRARIALEKAMEGLAPGADWGTRHAFTAELGDYNRATQPQVIGRLKSTGLSPFATAGWNFNKLGLSTLNPFPSVPGNHPGLRVAQGVLTSAAGHFALWQLAHLAITGMTPTDAKSDLFTIPMVGPGGEAIKNSSVGHLFGLDAPGAKLSMNVYSLPARGLRMLGGQALYNDTLGSKTNKTAPGGKRGPEKKAGDIARDMAAESFNTNIHPITGPPIRAASRFFGVEPSLVSTNEGFRLRSTIPQGTPSDKVVQESLKSGLTGLNPMADRFLTRGEDPKQLEPEVATKLTDMLIPRLVVHPYVPHKYPKNRTSQ